MTHSTFNRAAACALAITGLALTSPAARAEAGHSAVVYSTGSFSPTDPSLPVNTGFGSISALPDGSVISHMGCIAAVAGGVGCSTSGLPMPVTHWYDRPFQPTMAAAQGFADYGVLKARTWRGTAGGGDSQPSDPLGTRSFFARTTSEWSDDLIYTGAAPTVVTVQFTLHAKWNDLGRFAFSFGREYIGAENVRFIDGLSYINCAGAIECQSYDDLQTVPVPGNDAANTSGEVTLPISYSFLLYPQINDPEDPSAAEPHTFVANLTTWTLAPGSETEAFNTVTLDRILIQPGAQITFASGHNWPVQTVPEPTTWALWAFGLAGVLAARQRARLGVSRRLRTQRPLEGEPMKPGGHLLACVAAATAMAATPSAWATAYLSQVVVAAGNYYTDEGVVINNNNGQFWPTSDGSIYRYVVCVGSEPGQPGCSVPGGPPPPPTTWYEWPDLPSSAAAQAYSPDYGISRARAWSSGISGVSTGAPGYTGYGAVALSGWRDEINTTSSVPVVITFVVALHGNWNDGGVFGYQLGRPGAYDPEVGGNTPMDGWTWSNCVECITGYNTGPNYTVLPGAVNGAVDQIVTLNFTVYPDSFADPEIPIPYTNPVESQLQVYASYNDSEVDAFSTVTLQAILVPPNAGLTFASGHAYNVQVVPEPATWALWAFGLAGVLAARRRFN